MTMLKWLTTTLILALAAAPPIFAQSPAAKAPQPAARPARTTPLGFPQDAGPHDAASSIEWWYFNTFLTTAKGKRYALVGSFFRTGLTQKKKGHYLIYALADLSENRRSAYSIIDNAEVSLLKALLPLSASLKPDDPKPLQLLSLLQKGSLPAPHQSLGGDADVAAGPRFSIAFGANTLEQTNSDGRSWAACLSGDDWTADLTLAQPTRPAMLPGSRDRSGAKPANEMYYVSLSRMDVTGTLTQSGVVENVTGTGWLDRQWGSPAYVANYGWDWLGLQLDNGDDLILNRMRDLNTGKVVKVEATVLTKDWVQTVETPTVYRPVGKWTDPATGIVFPTGFTVTLPKSGYTLQISPAFADQTIPVIGIGEAIWEGAVNVTGTMAKGVPATGRGYMELVGYHAAPKVANTAQSTAKTGRDK